MSQTPIDDSDDSLIDSFYLPAVAGRPDISRVETILTDLFDGHGVVLIPETYSK